MSVTERGGCGDQGVDLLAQKGSTRIAFQCKFYDTPVGNEAVQQAHTGADILGVPYAAVVSRSSRARCSARHWHLLVGHGRPHVP